LLINHSVCASVEDVATNLLGVVTDAAITPSGDEGLQDVRIVQALYKSAASGRPVAIPPFTKRIRPSGRQRITRPGVRKPALVKVQSATKTEGPLLLRGLSRVQVDMVERNVPVRHEELESALLLPLELGAVGIQLRHDLFLGG
jgi:hypothetical protein